jgi:hypothetical protein
MSVKLNILFAFLLSTLWGRSQMMEEERISKVGIRAGFSACWLPGDLINKAGAPDRYLPRPREGFTGSIYNRLRMTGLIKQFNYRSNVKNWYFQYEVGAAFTGGNYKYKKRSANGSYVSSDYDLFRKISTFAIQTPLLFVWDIGNKQKADILFGFQPHYIAQTEIYKGNDYSALYFGQDINYDDLVKYKKWGNSALLGVQFKGEKAGFQIMFKYGLTSLNDKIVLTQDTNGNPDKYLPGKLIPFSLDFCAVF